MNLGLYLIDLKFHILVLDTPITNLELRCSRRPPSHHLCAGEKPLAFHYEVLILGKNCLDKKCSCYSGEQLRTIDCNYPHLPRFAYFVSF